MASALRWVTEPGVGAYDEMHDGDLVRAEYQPLRKTLDTLDATELRGRIDALATSYLDQGVTFDIGGEERAFPIDIVPRVITHEVWASIETGVQQRVRALEAFLCGNTGINER